MALEDGQGAVGGEEHVPDAAAGVAPAVEQFAGGRVPEAQRGRVARLGGGGQGGAGWGEGDKGDGPLVGGEAAQVRAVEAEEAYDRATGDGHGGAVGGDS